MSPLHSLFTELVLLNASSYRTDYSFGQFGSAASPPSALPTPSLLPERAWEEDRKTWCCTNTAQESKHWYYPHCFSHKWKHSTIQAAVKLTTSPPDPPTSFHYIPRSCQGADEQEWWQNWALRTFLGRKTCPSCPLGRNKWNQLKKSLKSYQGMLPCPRDFVINHRNLIIGQYYLGCIWSGQHQKQFIRKFCTGVLPCKVKLNWVQHSN